VYGGGNKYGRAVVGVIQLASASGNNPPSTTLKYTKSRFTAITHPKRGKGGNLAKLGYGEGARKTTASAEKGAAGRGRQDFFEKGSYKLYRSTYEFCKKLTNIIIKEIDNHRYLSEGEGNM
jgi:hypothetical protein